jgi:hypothetical protein
MRFDNALNSQNLGAAEAVTALQPHWFQPGLCARFLSFDVQ